MNEQLQTQIAEVLKALRDGAVEYGPQALNFALEVRRWDAVGRLSGGLVFLLLAYFGFRYVLKLYRREMAAFWVAKEGPGGRIKEPIQPYAILIGGGLAALALICEGLTRVLYVWHWVALFYPELAFAHDLLAKIGLARP